MTEFIITVKARAKSKERSLTIGPDGIFKIRTTAPPEKNKANLDIVDILAEHFQIPRSQIKLRSGKTANLKTFSIQK